MSYGRYDSRAESEFRRIPECGGAELLHARFGDFSFRKHAHERMAIGIVGDGAMRVDTRRGHFVAEPGTVITFNPDIVHWGGTVDGTPWSQNVLLMREADFARTLEDVRGKRADDKFKQPVITHTALFNRFKDLHGTLRAQPDPLAREGAWLDFVADLTQETGLLGAPETRDEEPAAVRLAREYIDAHFADAVTLEDLAAISGIGPYRLSRAFKKSVGMPPHTYQVHRRVREAEIRLRRGEKPADVAIDCGFADQAHLTRAFRQATALTPAQFRNG